MPDSNSLKEFVMSVRTRRRYYSQCTPEKTMHNTGILNYTIIFLHKVNYIKIVQFQV